MIMRKKEMELTRSRLANPQKIMKLAAMVSTMHCDSFQATGERK